MTQEFKQTHKKRIIKPNYALPNKVYVKHFKTSLKWNDNNRQDASYDSYSENNPAKFHPDPNWNYGALCFLRASYNENKMSSDMGSVPDSKITINFQLTA